MRYVTQTARPLELSQQSGWVIGLTLSASVALGVQDAIDDEAFLLFLADTVLDDEGSEDGSKAGHQTLTDPLHMIELQDNGQDHKQDDTQNAQQHLEQHNEQKEAG